MAAVEPLAVARLVTDAIERVGARYSIGGSLASSFAGEPRSTLDIDIVVDLTEVHVEPLLSVLADEFYVNAEALIRAVENHGTVNLIHVATTVKVDLFVAGGTPLDAELLRRRRIVMAGKPPSPVFVHTPEDILLQKLRWFRMGGEVSDRQWRDVLGIVRVQGQRLDAAYLEQGAKTLGVLDLLSRALKS